MNRSEVARIWGQWSKSLKWVSLTLFLLWLFAVVGPFYVVQKPFTLDGLAAITNAGSFTFSLTATLRTVWALLVALYLWQMNLGLGLWLLHSFKATSLTPLEKLIFATGLGFGVIGWLMLGLGLLGWLAQPILLTVTILLFLLGLPQTIRLYRTHHFERIPKLPTAYLAITLALALTLALLPPTDWDGLFYHLTGPKIYLQLGQIKPGIDIPHLNFPSLFEMHVMLAMALNGAVTAKLLHFGFALLLAGLVYLLAKQSLGLKSGWWAVLFLFSMPMVLTLAGWAYNDLALAFYQVGALYLLLKMRLTYTAEVSPSPPTPLPNRERGASNSRIETEGEGGDPKVRQISPLNVNLILSGLFCGLAMSLKYTSFVAPVTLVLLLVWWGWREKTGWLKISRQLGWFSLPALAIAAPWYLKSYFFTGNPVYPFIFGGHLWDAFRAAAYSSSGSGIGLNIGRWLALPYQLTLGIYDANYIDGRTGPLFLIFLPLILCYGFTARRRTESSALGALLFFALAQYAFWMVGVIWSQGLWQSRLLLPALVALAPVLAWILHDLRYFNLPQFSLQRFLKLVISLVLILGLVDQLFSDQFRAGWLHYRPWQYLIGQESEADYLSRRLGYHAIALADLNAQLPADAVVAFLWEPRSFYCQVECRPDSILDAFGHLEYLHGDHPAAIAQAWHDAGVTHVLVHRLGYNHLLNEQNTPPELYPNASLLQALEADYFDLIFDLDNAYQLYQLRE